MDPLISVIVPIYKVEPYLRRCLDSIVNQTYTNLEIILVDDGSPDGCPAICDEYAAKDKRIVVIHKENGGLSDARNAGLDICKGEYISFVDSDDWLANTFIEVSQKILERSKAELSITKFIKAKEFTSYPTINTPTTYKTYSSQESVKKLWSNEGVIFITAWGKLYKKDLWRNIRFPSGKVHEDEYTIYKILFYAKKTAYIKESLYFYFDNENSITRKEHSRLLSSLKAFEERTYFFKEQNEDEITALCVKDLCWHLLHAYKDYHKIKFIIESDYPQRKDVLTALNRCSKEFSRLKVSSKFNRFCLATFVNFPIIYIAYSTFLKSKNYFEE